jgi:pimeloyl-ACP methyl ester carboxylesterase
MAGPDATVERYSKRVMAADVEAVMDELGHERFAVIGHGRNVVALRAALDHPGRMSHLGSSATSSIRGPTCPAVVPNDIRSAYLDSLREPAVVRAICQDNRGLVDPGHDATDRAHQRRSPCRRSPSGRTRVSGCCRWTGRRMGCVGVRHAYQRAAVRTFPAGGAT